MVKQGYDPKTIIPCRISWCIGHQSSMNCDAIYNTDYLALSSRWGDPEEWSVVVYAWRIWQVLKEAAGYAGDMPEELANELLDDMNFDRYGKVKCRAIEQLMPQLMKMVESEMEGMR